jgi:hypothetical protein
MVKPKNPIGTRYKKPKYKNISVTRKLPKSKTSNMAPAIDLPFNLFEHNYRNILHPRLKSERVPTSEEEEDNIQISIEDVFPVNNNRSAYASASAYPSTASFNSKSQQQLIRKELEDRGAIPSMADDMMERTFSSSDIPNYPVTTRRVEMPSLMQISLDMNDVRTKIKETRAICESNEGTHLPVCVASAFSALGLMLPEDLMDEIEIQREQPIGRTEEQLLEYLYKKNIITSKIPLDFESEEELIAKLQLLLRTGNATIITVYGGSQLFSHMVLIVNAGPHIDRGGRHRSGLYCVDILKNTIVELDSETNAFHEYLSKSERLTDSILVYNGITITERLGLKRKMFPEEIPIRKKKLAPSKKRRLNGGRRTRKPLHL